LAERPKILCVDDEPRVLDGLSLQLGRHYQVSTAPNGQAGLEVLSSKGPFAVVISDMRMPGMDGAVFLARVRLEAPDAVRMLLTGYSDVESAIAAVNEGQIFRFLAKPCAPEHLRQAVAAASEQHRLISAEKVLLEQTLRGSIKTLIDVLSLSNPTAFGKATRIRDHASALASEVGITNPWQLDISAMLSQLGTVVLPEATLENYFRGQDLSAQEQAMVARVAALNQELLANIPRLELVREWIAELNSPHQTGTAAPRRWAEQCVELKILRIASDFDRLECEGLSTQDALDVMRGRSGWYDEASLEAFSRIRQAKTVGQVRELPLSAVAAGMILIADVRTTNGMLVLARGHQLTPSSVARLRNYPKGAVKEPIRVTEK
jgi:response regulator RpfG family c-di-GMP phosphodiesterase